MNPTEIVQQAKDQLSGLTGLKPYTVSSLVKDEGGWHVKVELIELKRIPESADILSTYDTHLDDSGNILRYERTRRYMRGEATQFEA
jgi:hypothetical protein